MPSQLALLSEHGHPSSHNFSIPYLEFNFRKRARRRSLQHVPIFNGEIALVAGTLQSLLLGRIDHGAREVRALLAVGNVACLVHSNQKAILIISGIPEYFRRAYGNLADSCNRLPRPDGTRSFR